MLTFLAGDEAVVSAAREIWAASGRLIGAKRELARATKRYQTAVADTDIPAPHAERLGAALILRLTRQQLLQETERTDPNRSDFREDDVPDT
jgi:HAMP domain-containing protein